MKLIELQQWLAEEKVKVVLSREHASDNIRVSLVKELRTIFFEPPEVFSFLVPTANLLSTEETLK